MDENNFEAIDLGEAVVHDFSIWGLFIQADVVVKLVMMCLVSLSFWSWVIVFQKKKFLKKLFIRADKFEEAFWSGEALDKIYSRVKKNKNDPMISTFVAGMEEWQSGVSGGVPDTENLRASLKQRVERSMYVAISKEMNKMEQGMTFLASVGSTAPFIGLFGTVWGIMNSFSSIAMSNNTNIAVVAPGIAEALFATALGLIAAIPAVIAYNIFTTSINKYGDRLETFMSEFAAILSRHLDQQSFKDDKPNINQSSINGVD